MQAARGLAPEGRLLWQHQAVPGASSKQTGASMAAPRQGQGRGAMKWDSPFASGQGKGREGPARSPWREGKEGLEIRQKPGSWGSSWTSLTIRTQPPSGNCSTGPTGAAAELALSALPYFTKSCMLMRMHLRVAVRCNWTGLHTDYNPHSQQAELKVLKPAFCDNRAFQQNVELQTARSWTYYV